MADKEKVDLYFNPSTNKQISIKRKILTKKRTKNVKSPYWDFVKSYHRENPELKFDEAREKADTLWKQMNSSQRKEFKKSSKRISDEAVSEILLSMAAIELKGNKLTEKEELPFDYNDTVESLLKPVGNYEQLKEKTFYIFSCSYYIKTSAFGVFPAEIAVAKFSLAQGVYKTMSFIIDQEELPLGASHEFMTLCEETHMIPLSVESNKEFKNEDITDYKDAFIKIQKFVGSDEETFPPFFVDSGRNSKGHEMDNSALLKISKMNGKSSSVFNTVPIEYLLMKLHDKCNELRKSDVGIVGKFISCLQMAKANFGRYEVAALSIGCDFHNSQDRSRFCSLAKVKDLGYHVAEWCLLENEEKIPGRHFYKTEQANFDDPITDSWSLPIGFEVANDTYDNTVSENSFVYEPLKEPSTEDQTKTSIASDASTEKTEDQTDSFKTEIASVSYLHLSDISEADETLEY
ncbi:CLUMA_CG012028, isoform A [Clunio marinus]|uniref:CLUMA_CG012028, isoform A n=1 Tax=Clunio marinus TaxID=568069 RepID=A0A1J1IJZ9_9DIPT|nr:CLUMA_CG012028, isoform A [Clunio marinus]